MIHVIATIKTNQGCKNKVLEALLAIQPKVLLEEGCHQYEPLDDVQSELPRQVSFRSDTIVLIEQWESVENLKTHLATPLLKQYQKMVGDWVQNVSLQVLKSVDKLL
ncbi:putative quinol monooxygenase [Neptuniibacter sp. 1_MG-2023]|jgi:quinol monooxygenase YgiN|uniref:putative quinol monooxygenase n=1 Tax=Neptuniibacter sp. 1_MG-2023 TaxID=3062662 RepID=UPI0026E2B8F7|nr:putative quinol monooxygenase [Neptuniibacter sp. 1_MG-2023]MDO6593383.1 putative quinol monooxygenase [Neptuniibacter sp. 1_MG-2023]